jgi:hypothetical protein
MLLCTRIDKESRISLSVFGRLAKTRGLPRQPVQNRARKLTARLSGRRERIVDSPFILLLLQRTGVSRNGYIGNVTPTNYPAVERIRVRTAL